MGTVLRPLVQSDLMDVFEIVSRSGLTVQSRDQWLEWLHWAVLFNPFRASAPIGHGIETDGVLASVVLYVYVPCKIGAWRGVAPIPHGLAAGKGVLGGIRLMQRLAGSQALLAHANDFGVKFFSRGSGRPIPASNVSATMCLSTTRRAIRWLSNRNVPGFPSIWRSLSAWKNHGKKSRRIGKSRTEGYLESTIQALPRETVDDLARCHLEMFDVGIEKSADYLRWRYTDGRGTFWAIRIENLGKIIGLAVLEETKERDCRVMEAIRRPGADIATSLVSAIRDSANSRGLVMIYTRAGDPEMVPVWENSGYSTNIRPNQQFWVIPGPVDLPAEVSGSYSHGDHAFH